MKFVTGTRAVCFDSFHKKPLDPLRSNLGSDSCIHAHRTAVEKHAEPKLLNPYLAGSCDFDSLTLFKLMTGCIF